jgi:acetaldehyde dehydrogenase
MKKKAAILGSGNIGTDLLVKMLERSAVLEPALLVGIDEESDGIARAKKRGVKTTAQGLEGLLTDPDFDQIAVVFDATSAKAHHVAQKALAAREKTVVDLTPAALGPYVVPVANLKDSLGHQNVNMVTCGGQATIPIVHALSHVGRIPYAEIVASIASRSAGPGTRANIDEFTVTTARGLEKVGGAQRAKAIIVLNPAEPPVIMRNTVYALVETSDEGAIRTAVGDMVRRVKDYVPGYQLKQDVVIDDVDTRTPDGLVLRGKKVTVFLEVMGAGHYLPPYAGNLDIMTSAALRTGEILAEGRMP